MLSGVPWWQVLLALLPFITLIVGFTLFRADALRLSLIVWVVEMFLSFFGFGLSFAKLWEASVWGNIVMWTGFLVLYSGQVFGQSFRSTGLLRILLDTLGRVLPTTEGKAMTLSSVVGGIIGAFNGFATYPVTIPGLVELGANGVQAAAGYLVYFAGNIAFVSLFIAATLANTATGLPIADIAQVMGLLTLPLVILSAIGFFRIMGYSLKKRSNILLIVLSSSANIAAILIFTQWLKEYYILTLIAAAVFTLILFYLFRRQLSDGESAQLAAVSAEAVHSRTDVIKSVAPLAIGAVLVVLWKFQAVLRLVGHAQFTVGLWGHKAIAINLLNTPGLFIFATAATCYVVATNPKANFWSDLKAATKRGYDSLLTMVFGSAMVYLMVDSGQINMLAKVLGAWGSSVYAVLTSVLTFLAGMAFGQGMPADLMFSGMQVKAAAALHAPLVVLVALAALMTMGPANPLKPSLLRYTSSLAKIKGEDGTLFRLALPWQAAALAIVAIGTVILLRVW
ncbi:MAG: L-lactate permease [Mycobacterium leprae]